MNGEGSQSDRDTTVKVDDNVVRLTDWLGPREELIPFGPGADAEEAARAARASQTSAVPTAQDFWSESSAAVQDALTVPHGNQDPIAAVPRGEQHGALARPWSHTRRGRASAAAIWERRRVLLRSRVEAGSAARTLPRHSFVGVLCLVVVAALVLVLSSGVLAPGAARRATLARTAAARTSSTSASAFVARHAAALAAASHAPRFHPVRRAARGSGPRRASSVQRARLHTRQTHHRATPASVGAAEPVGYTTPAPATAGSSSTSSQTAQTAPTSTSASPAVTGSGQKSSSAQPALGANGSLGPGSSPDG